MIKSLKLALIISQISNKIRHTLSKIKDKDKNDILNRKISRSEVEKNDYIFLYMNDENLKTASK